MTKPILSPEIIQNKIYLLRGQKVMLDRDLAILYQVSTRQINQAVKRNKNRFPKDFMFQLTSVESKYLRSQFVTANINPKSRANPHAFTEHGILSSESFLTLSSNLSSKKPNLKGVLDFNLKNQGKENRKMKPKTRKEFGKLLTVPGDAEYQSKYGSRVSITNMGNVTLVHLDQPTDEEAEERIDQVVEEVINEDLRDLDDDDCPCCRFMRDSFYDVVFDGDTYQVIACKPPLWA